MVTGGAGFIGSEVVKQLSAQEFEVIVLDNESSGRRSYTHGTSAKFVEGDIRDAHLVTGLLKRSEYILNLAAYPFIPDSYMSPGDFF